MSLCVALDELCEEAGLKEVQIEWNGSDATVWFRYHVGGRNHRIDIDVDSDLEANFWEELKWEKGFSDNLFGPEDV